MSLRLWCSLLLGTLALVASIGATAQATFKIDSLFSNLDGSVQFIVLTETAGLNGQHHFSGLKLTSTRGDVRREFTFRNDLPEGTAHMSIVAYAVGAGATELVPVHLGTNLWYCCYIADVYMPSRFLATDGGTVDFAGIDQMTYASLPTDGRHGLRRDGSVADAALPMHACGMVVPPGGCMQPTRIAQTPVTAVEYYHADLGHYFISASAPDLEALESGRLPGWQRTGFTFPAAPSATALPGTVPFGSTPMLPLCRFYLPPGVGNSHFLSASPQECAEVRARYPAFVLESEAAFYAALPDLATGDCPPSYFDFNDNEFRWLPVFRLWNRQPDTNHRYTINLFVRSTMIDQGYVSEGYGPAGVAFCVLQMNLQ